MAETKFYDHIKSNAQSNISANFCFRWQEATGTHRKQSEVCHPELAEGQNVMVSLPNHGTDRKQTRSKPEAFFTKTIDNQHRSAQKNPNQKTGKSMLAPLVQPLCPLW